MPTLLEKIEAEANEALALPPGRTPDQELPRYKQFLKRQSARLKMLHRAGGGGRELCQARAAVLDALQRQVMAAVIAALPAADRQPLPHFALIATGGYGRGELNPHSDIDIMFLHDGDTVAAGRGRLPKVLHALIQPGGLLYTLYDVGFKVGSSVRNIDDCVRIASTDMQSKTSLLEARLVAGDEGLFKRFQAVLITKCIRGQERAYIEARLEDQAARRARFGNSACMMEPNIKSGCGGLRDYQNLLWMTFVKYRTRSLAELAQRELISNAETKMLDSAYDFLLRVRTELHYHCGRAMDTLQRGLQPSTAHGLGYQDRSPVRRMEKFMRDLYKHTRNIYLITHTLEQRLALLPQPDRRLPSLRDIIRKGRQRVRQQIHDGFRIVEGSIHATSTRIFRDQPRRLMKVFLYAQQRGLQLQPDVVQLVRNQLAMVDRSFLRDEHVRATFLEILGRRGMVAGVLRTMHDCGLLGKYLPEFGRLTCLVQHEFFHRYTADEHTLICLEKLDQIWETKEAQQRPYEELFRAVERPFVLYLALLLHDAGKAADDDHHADASSQLALRAARRLGLDQNTTTQLQLLVEQHLLMAEVSQRHDIDDPSVIEGFVQRVPTLDTLNMLTLLTYADSLGTSDQLWNGFKDASLWSLFHKARQRLIRGAEGQREEERQRVSLAEEIRKLIPRSFGDDELQGHFGSLPARYFLIHQAREVARHLSLVHRFMHRQLTVEDQALAPVVDWRDEPDRGFSTVDVCTWDRVGLFSKIAGSLTAAGLNILSAHIFSRTDGIILDTFYVIDARSGLLPGKPERAHFEEILVDALAGELDLAALIAKRKPTRPPYSPHHGESLPTRVHFDNDRSATRSVIDLETEDRVGLLFTVSQVISDLGLSIDLARISTDRGAAVDSFYVSEKDGSKVRAPERQHHVERRLLAAVQELAGSRDG